MRQRVHLITLGVDDLSRAARFYEALGWRRAEGCPPGLVAFDLFGATLALYPRQDLARDIGRPLPRGSGAVALACNVRERAEVAETVEAARRAGATILKGPEDVFWGGHVAYLEDPEGHLWEIAWNPRAPLGPDDAFRWAGFPETVP
mgnify:CR=1 FL=1